MTDPYLLLLIPLALVAFFLKGIATFGAGIVLVPLGALLIGAKEVVLLIGILDLISNLSLYRPRRADFNNPFLIRMTLALILGVAVGAYLFKLLPVEKFEILFALILLPLGLWIALAGFFKFSFLQSEQTPERASKTDIGVSLVSGLVGGVSGLAGPILAWYMNQNYSKQIFRELMLPLLLVSAIARTGFYAAAGAYHSEMLPLVLLAVPGLFIGVALGNRYFFKLSQKWFNRVVGSLITLSGIKLLVR